MNSISPDTIALIEKRPSTAVKIISAMEAQDAAAFLETLPTRHSALIFTKLNALPASEIVPHMLPFNSAALLAAVDYEIAASIIRVLADANRKTILSALPKRLAQDLKASVSYPPDTVGAKMSTNIVTLTPDQTTGEALAELRKKKRAKTGTAYVVDSSRKLMGFITAEELLQRSNEARLDEAMDISITPISARARLSSVSGMAIWDDYAQVPVTNRQRVLIGALHRRVFRRSTKSIPTVVSHQEPPSLLAAMVGAFTTTFVGLSNHLTDTPNGLETSRTAPPKAAISGEKS